MSKETVLNLFLNNGLSYNELLNFFDSHICIPKGENCHPYHMELHQWAENPLVDLQVFNDTNGAFTLSIMDEYHIKPSEPIYEWRWYYINDKQGVVVALEGDKAFFTESELSRDWKKFEETKRVRS